MTFRMCIQDALGNHFTFEANCDWLKWIQGSGWNQNLIVTFCIRILCIFIGMINAWKHFANKRQYVICLLWLQMNKDESNIFKLIAKSNASRSQWYEIYRWLDLTRIAIFKSESKYLIRLIASVSDFSSDRNRFLKHE